MNHHQWRSLMYDLLALPLTEPDPEAFELVCSGRWAAELAEALAALGLDLSVPATLGARPFAQAVQQYRETFAPPRPPLHPVESIYKIWTTLPGAEVPMASQMGWLGGDSAAHLTRVYQELGITIPPAMSATPDHLALELSFMSLLIDHGGEERAAQFRAQHLDWLNALVDDAVQKQVAPFYRDLLTLTAAFVAEDRHAAAPPA